MSATDAKVEVHLSDQMIAVDPKLQAKKAEFEVLHRKYQTVASDAVIELTAKNAKARGFQVEIAATKAAALALMLAQLPTEGKGSFGQGASTSLHDVGFTEWAKTQTKHDNQKDAMMKAFGTPDIGKYVFLNATADVFYTSPSALTQAGQLHWASAAPGSRVSLHAKRTVFVVGANKIVEDLAAAQERQNNYVIPLVGAVVRQKYGMPDTAANEIGTLNGGSFFNPTQFLVIIVKEPLGF